MPSWMSYKLESGFQGEIANSDLWMISNDAKQRGTSETLDEGKGEEWKSQLKTQY